jgi:hypothetical protein
MDAPAELDATTDPTFDPAGEDVATSDPAPSDPAGEEGTAWAVPTCMQRCTTVSECGSPATPAYSPDNYACTEGFCIYAGCNSDSECVDSVGSGYGCDFSSSPAYCQPRCASASECGQPTMPAYTSEHYACTGGFCVYTGCRSDAECVDTLGAGYGCDASMTVAYCVETCASSADCGSPATPAYSSDNYDCTGGYCVYAGCNSHAECVDSMGGEYGCMGL